MSLVAYLTSVGTLRVSCSEQQSISSFLKVGGLSMFISLYSILVYSFTGKSSMKENVVPLPYSLLSIS